MIFHLRFTLGYQSYHKGWRAPAHPKAGNVTSPTAFLKNLIQLFL